MKKAISGPDKGQVLRQLPARHTTWRLWKKAHPNTLIQSRHTGYKRDYARDPYEGYEHREGLYFPVAHRDRRMPSKTWVLGVELGGKAKAYPLKLCPAPRFSDTVGGRPIRIVCDKNARTAYVLDDKGKELETTLAYWFAWAAFHPATQIYTIEISSPTR